MFDLAQKSSDGGEFDVVRVDANGEDVYLHSAKVEIQEVAELGEFHKGGIPCSSNFPLHLRPRPHCCPILPFTQPQAKSNVIVHYSQLKKRSLLVLRFAYPLKIPNMSSRNLLLLCLVLSGLSSLHAETRHIHVIQMLDDNSPTYLIREGCRSIDYGVQREVDRVKDALGISNVHYYRLNGLNFNRESLEFVVDYQLSYQERDIIIFVYTGHGFRDAGSPNQLPKLYFNGYDSAMEGDELRLRLVEKNPSLLLNIVIACNAVQRDHRVAPGQPEDDEPGQNRLAGSQQNPRAYEILFADQPGFTKVIDLVSSDREFETYISRDGGIFFSEVLYAFEEVFVDQRLSNWDAVCNYIKDQTLLRTANRQLPQKPYCAYNIFRAMADAPVVITATDYPAGLVNCRKSARELRKEQRQDLKALRRRHRTEIAGLSSRNERRLTGSRQDTEMARMKYVHLQDYQRQLESCK